MSDSAADVVDIREALPADGLALLQAIHQMNWETEYLGMPGEALPWAERPADFIREMHERGAGAYIIAVCGGTIVGYLGAYSGEFARTRGVVFIAHVGVRQALRGYGIGTQLLIAVEGWARDRNAHRLELRVDESNQRGLVLYHRRGFNLEGRVADAAMVDGVWHTHYWMAKPLAVETRPEWETEPLSPPAPNGGPEQLAIRAVRVEDAVGLRDWERRLLRDGPRLWLKQPGEILSEAEMAERIAAGLRSGSRLMWAATALDAGRERIVGRLDGWPLPGQRACHDGHFALNVSPDYWGRGLGRRLAGQLETWARSQGLRRLSTTVLAHNARGRRFAEAQGFVCEAVSPAYATIDDRPVGLLRFGKLLQASGQASDPVGA